MKRAIAALTIISAICLASQSVAQVSGPGGAGGAGGISGIDPGGGEQPDAKVDLPQEPEARAEGFRLSGDCDRAIPIFRALADKGAGYEIAEYNLGLCLFDTAKATVDPKHAQDLKQEAAGWILKAANFNFASAQVDLVSRYLDGDGVVSNPLEAAKWALIYRANGQRFVFGLPGISSDLQARLDSKLSAQNWADVQIQADAWTPAVQNSGN
jgi:hypothetical protein